MIIEWCNYGPNYTLNLWKINEERKHTYLHAKSVSNLHPVETMLDVLVKCKILLNWTNLACSTVISRLTIQWSQRRHTSMHWCSIGNWIEFDQSWFLLAVNTSTRAAFHFIWSLLMKCISMKLLSERTANTL